MRNYSDEEIQRAEHEAYDYQDELEQERVILLRHGVQKTVGEIVETHIESKVDTMMDTAIELNREYDQVKRSLESLRDDANLPGDVLHDLALGVFKIAEWPKAETRDLQKKERVIPLESGYGFKADVDGLRLGKESEFLSVYNWSVRTYNCLWNDNIKVLWDLLPLSRVRLLRIPNFWRKGLLEIESFLERLWLRLWMSPAEINTALSWETVLKFVPTKKTYARDTDVTTLAKWPGRIARSFQEAKITTFEELLRISSDTLLEASEFGVRSLDVLRDKLKEIDPRLHLSMSEQELQEFFALPID